MLLLLWNFYFNNSNNRIKHFFRLWGSINIKKQFFLFVIINQRRRLFLVNLYSLPYSFRLVVFSPRKPAAALVASVLLLRLHCNKIVYSTTFAAVPPCC